MVYRLFNFLCKYKYEFILLVVFVLIIPTFLTVNLWYDELMTTPVILGYNLFDIIEEIKSDAHPPLYYILLKLYSLVLGTSIIALKTFNIVVFLILLIIMYCQSKGIVDRRYARIYLALLILMPSFYNELFQLRMYILAPLFATLAALYAVKTYNSRSKKTFVLFIIWSLAASYTHYVALVFVGVIHLFLYVALLRKSFENIKRIVCMSLTMVVLYLPWLFIILYQLSIKEVYNGDTDSIFSRIVKSVIYPFYTGNYAERGEVINYVLTILLVFSFIFLAWIYIKEKKIQNVFPVNGKIMHQSFIIPIVVLAFFLGYTFIKTPIWYSRYLLILMPTILMGVAYIIYQLKPVYMKSFFVILSLCFVNKIYQINLITHDEGMKKYSQLDINKNDTIINANPETSTYFRFSKQYSSNPTPVNWDNHIRWNVNFETNYQDLNLTSFWAPETKEEFQIGKNIYKRVEKHEFEYSYQSKGRISISKYEKQ